MATHIEVDPRAFRRAVGRVDLPDGRIAVVMPVRVQVLTDTSSTTIMFSGGSA